jgi:hypothetical protein
MEKLKETVFLGALMFAIVALLTPAAILSALGAVAFIMWNAEPFGLFGWGAIRFSVAIAIGMAVWYMAENLFGGEK